ncbi:MAG: hypothetical protein U9R73_00420 [Pseudomonadota bacterium]|nr:hypothetical protein [Pseudomonadota bacterium]
MLWLIRKLTARGFSAAGAKVALMIGAVFALLAIGAATSCTVSHFRGQAKQAKVNTSQAEAAADAGANALDVTRQTATKHTETDQTVKDGTDAIRSAPDGASAALAARCANCGLRVYRDTWQCAGLLASGDCKRFTPSD